MTIIGVLLVLVVMGSLAAITLPQQERRLMDTQLDNIQGSADLLGLAMNGYYADTCDSTVFQQPSVLSLLQSGYFNNAGALENSLGVTFDTIISNPQTTRVEFWVEAQFASSALASNVAGKKSNATATGLYVRWVYKPRLNSTTALNRGYALKDAFEASIC